jgi:hypothetical protein
VARNLQLGYKMAENKDTVLGPIKRKIKNQKIKESSKGSVKLVAPTADAARAAANAKAANAAGNAKSGAAARVGAQKVDVTSKPKTTVNIRSNPGISGKGGAMVGALYRPMSGGGATNQYNK